MTDASWPWRARFGILVNHNDAVPETEFWALAPPGVTIQTARFEGPRQRGQDYGPDAAELFAGSPELARGAELLGRMRLDAICVCFTTASVLAGPGFDADLIGRLSAHTNAIPVTTAAVALRMAMDALELRRPLLVFPPWFSDPLLEAAERYFRALGFEVEATARVSLGETWRGLETYEIYDRGGQWELRSEHVYKGIRSHCPSTADSVVVVGNGLYAIDAIAPLEEDLKRPVVTANQAGLWHCMSIARVRAGVHGYGRLFEIDATREEV